MYRSIVLEMNVFVTNIPNEIDSGIFGRNKFGFLFCFVLFNRIQVASSSQFSFWTFQSRNTCFKQLMYNQLCLINRYVNWNFRCWFSRFYCISFWCLLYPKATQFKLTNSTRKGDRCGFLDSKNSAIDFINHHTWSTTYI